MRNLGYILKLKKVDLDIAGSICYIFCFKDDLNELYYYVYFEMDGRCFINEVCNECDVSLSLDEKRYNLMKPKKIKNQKSYLNYKKDIYRLRNLFVKICGV